ncbi:MAG: replicative DNA helicase [bacterium]
MEQKVMPQNLEAEKSVLGGILIDKDAIYAVSPVLKPPFFYNDNHSEIFEAMLDLFDQRSPIDLITLPARLKKRKTLKRVGGVGYLSELASFVPTAANIEHHANLIKEEAIKRELIKIGGEIAESAFNENAKAADLLNKAESRMFGIGQESLKQDFVPIKKVLEVSFDRLDELHKTAGALRGVSTGLKSLDAKLSGLQESNMVVLAARPSIGKTSLALNIAQYAAVAKKQPVGIFSLETSREQLVDRMLAGEADIDGWKIATGNLTDNDFKEIGKAMGVLAEAPIFIDDTPGITINEMRTKARRLHIEQGVKLIVIDYIQLCQGRGLESRVQEVSEISQAIKNIARELKIPVLALSQLSRAIESRGEKKPQLSDLRESGSIEQDADVVMFLYRPDEEDRGSVNLLISKHRNGPTGELSLYFRGERTKFYESEKLHEAEQ